MVSYLTDFLSKIIEPEEFKSFIDSSSLYSKEKGIRLYKLKYTVNHIDNTLFMIF